jgi:hypothetical protein
MARSDTRYSVYPAPKATEILGNTAPALNQAIECWAALVTRAMADNARRFSSQESPDLFGQTGHALHDWAFLAEGLKEVRVDSDFPNPSAILASALEDANRLHDLGAKWFYAEHLEDKPQEYIRLRETDIETVIEDVRKLDYPHAWALVLAVGWYWQHADDGVDLCKDSWWSLGFRREWSSKSKARKAKDRK